MSYINVYPSRINWENEPSIASPINATNLNKIDYAAYQFDQTFATWDVTKANQSDLLLSVKSIDYNTSTGVFVFTWQNGTTKTVDLNIEKIPVSFSMSPQGVITMTTDDGTQYTADVGSLIKTYTFDDSTEIDFTVTTDASGNKTVTAALKDGSIVGTKLEPNYLANCQSAANSASASKTAAEGSSEDSEAWAVGTRDGVPVPSSDPAYENNAKYWAQHTSASLAGLTDTDITSPTNGQVLTYDGSKWVNDDPSAGGGSKIIITTIDTGLYSRPVTISDGTTTLTGAFDNTGEVTFEGVTLTGSLTVSSSTSGGTTTTMTITVPYFGNYEFELTDFEATITATYPTGASCTLTGQGESQSATSNPQTFTVSSAGTYTITVVDNGVTSTGTVTVSTSGESKSIEVGWISATVTLYSAVEDTVSFTDATGSNTEVFATGQSSKSNVDIKVLASSPSVTFTSSVAKNPDNLSAYFSKSATITSATTEIKVMPDNALYWWGYNGGVESCTTANGWSHSSWAIQGCTFNTNSVTTNTPTQNQTVNAVGTVSPISFTTAHVIGYSSVANNGAAVRLTSKSFNSQVIDTYIVLDTTTSHKTLTPSSQTTDVYLDVHCSNATTRATATVYALWYE